MDTKTKEYYAHCGIKEGWHNKTLAEYHNDEDAKKVVVSYLKKIGVATPKFELYLWGSNGTGKSHLMNCAFKNMIAKGCKVRIYTMDEIVTMFTSSWYSDEDRHALDNILRNVDFLGIDEFGKNVDKDGKPIYLPDLVRRVMESVIRYRVQTQKPLWITSNTDPKFVSEVFSEDIASLLNEAVIAVCVRGSDYRKRIQKENKESLL